MLKSIVAAGLVTGLTLISGCASQVDLTAVNAGGLKPVVLSTRSFPIQGMLPHAGTYSKLRVYIEGDGHAWATSSQPSTDPTPHTSVMLDLASSDRSPAAYIARPCQFVTSKDCNTSIWTDSRFSRPEIEAMNAAVSDLKSRFSVQSFELIGHSGGGEVALVLAGIRDDVEQVQTIAGNVEPLYWTKLHQLTPLNNPITPLMYKDRLRDLPQRHIVGTKDTVVPPSVSQAYSVQLEGTCLEIVAVNATHLDGYNAIWNQFSNTPLLCKGR